MDDQNQHPVEALPPRTADGWRGVVGASIDERTLAALAVAACEETVAAAGGRKRLLLCCDNRPSSPAFLRAVQAAASSLALETIGVAPNLPTPFASAAVSVGRFDLAILVTASHNPWSWNGLKLKVPPGRPPASAVEAAVHERAKAILKTGSPHLAASRHHADAPADAFDKALSQSIMENRIDAIGRQFGHCIKQGLTVAVDGLGGVAGGPMQTLCARFGWTPLPVGDDRQIDLHTIGPDPSVPERRIRAMDTVRRRKASFGVVLDGDGDRIYVIDDLGRLVHPHELAAYIIWHATGDLAANVRGRLFATVATGALLKKLARALDRPMTYTPIGFKNIADHLLSEDHAVAAGGVGDMALGDFSCDRDPFLVIAAFGAVFSQSSEPLSIQMDRLRRHFGTDRLNWIEHHVRKPLAPSDYDAFLAGAARRLGMDPTSAAADRTDGLRLEYPDGQWLLVRASTTEGGTRVYGEVYDDSDCRRKILEAFPGDWRGQRNPCAPG